MDFTRLSVWSYYFTHMGFMHSHTQQTARTWIINTWSALVNIALVSNDMQHDCIPQLIHVVVIVDTCHLLNVPPLPVCRFKRKFGERIHRAKPYALNSEFCKELATAMVSSDSSKR